MRYLAIFFLLFLICSYSSCNECLEDVPQKYRFGVYEGSFSCKSIVKVGDTLAVSISLPLNFYDSLSSKAIQVDEGISLFIPITSYRPISDTVSVYRNFNQHFGLNILEGSRTDVYNFACVNTGTNWNLTLHFIPKLKGSYYFSIGFQKIGISEAALPRKVCMLGNSLFDTRLKVKADNNKIAQMFKADLNYFGLVVE